jgi:hypothetical protein
MILADFFLTQSELDTFVMSLPVNHMAGIGKDNALYRVHANHISPAGLVRGVLKVEKIQPAKPKKKYRHH